MRTKSLVATAAVLLTFIAVGPSALAASFRSNSSVTVNSITTTGLVSGTLSSASAKCVAGRTVRVERNGQTVGNTTANADGTWTLTNAPVQPGDSVTAFVSQVVVKHRKKKTICEAAQSLGAESGQRLVVQVTGDFGQVSSQPPGINSCTPTSGVCLGTFGQGQQVVLTATPVANAKFAGWGGDCSGTATTCTVTMLGDRNVSATFLSGANNLLTVAVSNRTPGRGHVDQRAPLPQPGPGQPPGPGITSCGFIGPTPPPTVPNCSQNYNAGTNVILEATPDGSLAGSGLLSRFDGWGGDCASFGTRTTCSILMVGNKNVSASFSAQLPGTSLASNPSSDFFT